MFPVELDVSVAIWNHWNVLGFCFLFFWGGGRFPTCEYCDGWFRSAERHFTIDGYWIIFSSFGISHSRHSDRVIFVFEPCSFTTSVRWNWISFRNHVYLRIGLSQDADCCKSGTYTTWHGRAWGSWFVGATPAVPWTFNGVLQQWCTGGSLTKYPSVASWEYPSRWHNKISWSWFMAVDWRLGSLGKSALSLLVFNCSKQDVKSEDLWKPYSMILQGTKGIQSH